MMMQPAFCFLKGTDDRADSSVPTFWPGAFLSRREFSREVQVPILGKCVALNDIFIPGVRFGHAFRYCRGFSSSPLPPQRDPREIFSGCPATREYDGSRDELARAVDRSVPESRSDKLTASSASGNSVRRIDIITIESYRVMPMNRPLDYLCNP